MTAAAPLHPQRPMCRHPYAARGRTRALRARASPAGWRAQGLAAPPKQQVLAPVRWQEGPASEAARDCPRPRPRRRLTARARTWRSRPSRAPRASRRRCAKGQAAARATDPRRHQAVHARAAKKPDRGGDRHRLRRRCPRRQPRHNYPRRGRRRDRRSAPVVLEPHLCRRTAQTCCARAGMQAADRAAALQRWGSAARRAALTPRGLPPRKAPPRSRPGGRRRRP
mmetsp:Transcript_25945/g.72395  ORF Transcript_25945/g.72395 Transcript_25945/m.72395 type:complete len:225 (-) Transcript_25945:1582-2256(-)